MGPSCAQIIVVILTLFAIWATLGPLMRSNATSSHFFAEFPPKTRKHQYFISKTHICGGHLPRLNTLLATLLVQNLLREPLLPSSRRLCGHGWQCEILQQLYSKCKCAVLLHSRVLFFSPYVSSFFKHRYMCHSCVPPSLPNFL